MGECIFISLCHKIVDKFELHHLLKVTFKRCDVKIKTSDIIVTLSQSMLQKSSVTCN